MRLDFVSKCSFLQRVQLKLVEQIFGLIPGPIVCMTYSRDIFGKYAAQCFQEAMRQMKHWSIGEVELFAAFVSKLNQCAY